MAVEPFSTRKHDRAQIKTSVKRRLPFDWRRVVVYAHRWLGIAGSLIFVAWFASGIVMMYARMPELTPAERLAGLSPLDLSAVRVSPEQAASRLASTLVNFRMAMLGGRAVYRFLDGNRSTTMFADDGETLTGITADQAVAEVQRFAPEHAATARYDRYLRDPISGPSKRGARCRCIGSPLVTRLRAISTCPSTPAT